jgi:hypothetical protein
MADYRSGSADAVEATMREGLQKAGLEIIRYRTITTNIVEARTIYAPAIAMSLPWLIQKLLRKELGDPRTDPRVMALADGRSNYFILTARHC